MTPLNRSTCRDCGGRLLGTETFGGRCGVCERGLEVEVRGKVALQPKVALHDPETSSATPSSVALPVESSVTKQQKYRQKNLEKTKADTAARVARWRDGQRRRRAAS